jgi:hypothetical protein
MKGLFGGYAALITAHDMQSGGNLLSYMHVLFAAHDLGWW